MSLDFRAFADRAKAYKYFVRAKDMKKAAECAYFAEDYSSLVSCIKQAPEASESLK